MENLNSKQMSFIEAFEGVSDIHSARWVPVAYAIFETLRDDPEVLSWYIDLNFLAAWKDTTKVVGRKSVKLRKGQLVASLAFLCQRWRRSKKKVLAFLRQLEEQGIIKRETKANITVLTVREQPLHQPLEKKGNNLCTNLWNNKGHNPCDNLNDNKSSSCEKGENKRGDNLWNNKGDNKGDNKGHHLRDEKGDTRRINIEYTKKIEDSSSSTKEEDDGKLNFSDFIDFFNCEIETKQSSIPKISSLNAARVRALRERAAEHGADALSDAVRKAVASDWLNGQNKSGWTATFDWIFSPLNFVKILEGNYDNKEKREGTNEKGNKAGIRCAFIEVEATSADDYEEWD